MSWAGCQNNPIDVNFHLIWKFLKNKSADKISSKSKKDKGMKVSPPVPNKVKQPTGAGITASRVRVGCSSDSTVNSSSLGVQKWWNTSYSQLYGTPIVYVHKVWNPIFQVNILTWLTSFNNKQLFLTNISHYMSFCQNKRGDIWPKLPYFPTFYCHQ